MLFLVYLLPLKIFAVSASSSTIFSHLAVLPSAMLRKFEDRCFGIRPESRPYDYIGDRIRSSQPLDMVQDGDPILERIDNALSHFRIHENIIRGVRPEDLHLDPTRRCQITSIEDTLQRLPMWVSRLSQEGAYDTSGCLSDSYGKIYFGLSSIADLLPTGSTRNNVLETLTRIGNGRIAKLYDDMPTAQDLALIPGDLPNESDFNNNIENSTTRADKADLNKYLEEKSENNENKNPNVSDQEHKLKMAQDARGIEKQQITQSAQQVKDKTSKPEDAKKLIKDFDFYRSFQGNIANKLSFPKTLLKMKASIYLIKAYLKGLAHKNYKLKIQDLLLLRKFEKSILKTEKNSFTIINPKKKSKNKIDRLIKRILNSGLRVYKK